MSTTKKRPLFDPPIIKRAIVDACLKLDPRRQIRNPVMFTVYVGSILTTGLFVYALANPGAEHPGFVLGVSLWLWFTVLFANFAEAMAEGRGKAQADNLRKSRTNITAKKLADARRDSERTPVLVPDLRKGDVVIVEAGDFIPMDGEIIEGAASVDESAVTGESAPVIREAGVTAAA